MPTVTVIDLRVSSFDAAAGVVTGISALRIAPEAEALAVPFDWQLPVAQSSAMDEMHHRRQIAAFQPVWPDLCAYLAGGPVVAHGAAWTRTVLRKATLAVGVEWVPPMFLCTRRMARAFYPDRQSYDLDRLVAELDLTPQPPISGVSRCLAVAELYRRCLRRMHGAGLTDIAELDAFLARPGGFLDRGAGRS